MSNDIEIKNYYEYYEKNSDDGINRLFYAIMYRNWQEVAKYIENKQCNWDDIKEQKYKNTDITIEDCFSFNLDFLCHPKNQIIYQKICEQFGDEFKNIKCNYEFCNYDDKRFCKIDGERKSVFDVFWDGNQPVLNIKYFEKQTLAAKQVMKNNCSMVLDEVGTGKTVCGIYTIQQVIQENINSDDKSDGIRILVICPYNKREDWHNDILRQLGLESNIINQSDDGETIRKRSKIKSRAYIYISGNIGGKGNGNDNQLKKAFLGNWDLVIIDECHNCFDSYSEVKAKRVLMLTATPIVSKSDEIRNFLNYKSRMSSIINGMGMNKKINPIEKRLSNNDDIYTCYFKEDIFDNVKIKRDIRFIECERTEKRDEWFYKLRYEKDFFSAVFSDQDDEILSRKCDSIFGHTFNVEKNNKLDILCDIIFARNNFTEYSRDSFIVFCETTDTVDLIYERLSANYSGDLMIGKMYSNIAEIKNHRSNKANILQKLKGNIRNGKRSVLIITGKSGGTGINLGEFTGVIHYELPFTSNELEQRFGRIERADNLIEIERNETRTSICNKMIFLINNSNEKNDFITNRMLYYAVNKIRITARYMPIRNTVLFHPEYIKRVVENGKSIWKSLKEVLEKNSDMFSELNDYLKYEKAKKETVSILNKSKINQQKSLEDRITDFLENTTGQQADDIELIRKFREKITNTQNVFHHTKSVFKANDTDSYEWYGGLLRDYIEYYLFMETTLKYWGQMDSNKFPELTTDEENTTIENADNRDTSGDSKKLEDKLDEIIQSWGESEELKETVNGKIEKMITSLEKMNSNNTLNYSGIFYIDKNNQIQNIVFD